MSSLPYVPSPPSSPTSTGSRIISQMIFEYAKSLSTGPNPIGIIGDDVIVHLQGKVESSTITARLKGLKDAGLLVQHPDNRTRMTRRGRTAEVWVVPPGADYTKQSVVSTPSNNSGPSPRSIIAAARKLVEAHESGTTESRDKYLRYLLALFGATPAAEETLIHAPSRTASAAKGVFGGLRKA